MGIAEFDMTRYPQAKGLKAVIGIEDMVGQNGKVTFVVEGRVQGQWRELYRSSMLKGGDQAIPIEVIFPEGMAELRLKTTDGGDGPHSDHALWADAQFTESD